MTILRRSAKPSWFSKLCDRNFRQALAEVKKSHSKASSRSGIDRLLSPFVKTLPRDIELLPTLQDISKKTN